MDTLAIHLSPICHQLVIKLILVTKEAELVTSQARVTSFVTKIIVPGCACVTMSPEKHIPPLSYMWGGAITRTMSSYKVKILNITIRPKKSLRWVEDFSYFRRRCKLVFLVPGIIICSSQGYLTGALPMIVALLLHQSFVYTNVKEGTYHDGCQVSGLQALPACS